MFYGREGETYVLRWIIRNECGLTMDDIIISFKPPCRPKPSDAAAGPDQIEVEDCKLNAEHPTHGKGRWKIVSGKDGRLSNPDSNVSYLYGQAGETYLLNWTVKTKCGHTTDQIKVKFSSYCPREFTDARDGKKYQAMRIAGQCWMKENLRYLPNESVDHCYEGFIDHCEDYGALYTWDIAMNGDRKAGDQGICPKGWHLPTDKEWDRVVDSSGFNGKELQVSGVSGFNIPMGGARYTNGKYFNRGEYAYYWSSTERDKDAAWNRYFPDKTETSDRFPAVKSHSFSIRCVKDDD